MFRAGGSDETVEMLMSITRAEFETGVARLTGAAPRTDSDGDYVLAGVGPGGESATCRFEPLPGVVLGGLMRLPRSRVRLDLAALPSAARAEFLGRFERTFQRGGG